MVDFVLVVPLGEGEGDRHQYVDVVAFVVDLNGNVAVFFGFGSGDDAKGGLESPEGGYLWGSGLDSFGDFDHF